MIKKIFWGSLRNKLLIILPALLLISAFIPWIIPFILMLGGTYLCYEGAEKVWHKLRGHHEAGEDTPAVDRGPDAEGKVVKGAITTDFILSCEIMVIAMNEVASDSLWVRALILVVVAFVITIAVYGAVALIVKMDDVGLHLTTKDSAGSKRFGELLVRGMPTVLAAITLIGTVAMLWVGGHIMLQGAYDLGWHLPYDLVHALEHPVEAVPVMGGFLAWLVNTLCSAVLGLAWGLVVMAVLVPLLKVLPFGKKKDGHQKDGHQKGDVPATADGQPAVDGQPAKHDADPAP
jgi:predicted DNA repair protein MutK